MAERREGEADPHRTGVTTDDGLERLINRHAPGRHVLVVGCRTGRHALALARAGYTVTGLDRSPSAIDQARRGAAQLGLDIRWHVVDPSALARWPLGTVDAAICMGWQGQGRRCDHRRLFARIRRHLTPGGLLVIEYSQPPDLRGYDEATGRSADGLRLYRAVELSELVRGAGFSIEQVDVKAPGDDGAGAVTVVARPVSVPPHSLAVADWGATADGVRLDLRYADDEAEWLQPTPREVWAELVNSVDDCGAGAIAHYPVDDPFGAVRGAPVVSRYFECPIAPGQLTFAAGVTSLLHDLSGLADGGPILAPASVHPDLLAWGMARGAEVRLLTEPVSHRSLLESIASLQPTLVHLDRPAFTAEVLSLDEMSAVARAAAAVGALLLVDESPATYLPPTTSSVHLVDQTDNMVVLRGFTKAYSWGGLRGGFAVCSPALAEPVRELIAPMQVGELALRAALRLLGAGDACSRLRARTRMIKPWFAARLASAGLPVVCGHEDVAWVVVADGGGTARRFLAERGIRGLLPVPLPVAGLPPVELLHLTVPLSIRRIRLFDALTAQDRATDGRPA
jgi:histidinol-phosphate/aromatic aminotransferase/cobyric acid decarboxylase-like protein